jgi:hypothetical protein
MVRSKKVDFSLTYTDLTSPGWTVDELLCEMWGPGPVVRGCDHVILSRARAVQRTGRGTFLKAAVYDPLAATCLTAFSEKSCC